MKTIILLFSLIFLAFAVTITQYVEAQSQGIGTVSPSGFSPTEYPLVATAGINMYDSGDAYNLLELGDDNVIVGNLINLTNIKITKITLAENSGFSGECFVRPCSPNVNATNATMTAKIWSNVTIGSSRFSDLIEEASTETINIQDYIIPFTPFPPPFDSRHPNFPITFNFTTPITLTGEYLVGFEFHDIQQNLTVVTITSSSGGASPDQDIESVYSVCIGDPTSPTFNFTDVLSDCPDNIENGSGFNPVRDWFFEIIAEKTVSDLSVNTSIAPTKLRGYWTFDDNTVDDQLALNAGTVGHEGDATMIDYRLGSNKTLTRNSTGLIGASYIHDGTKNLFNGTVTDTANYLQVGTFTNDNQKNWNFLHQMGTTANKTATSLWIRVNSTSTLPTNTVGFIASQSVGTGGNGMMYGMGTGNTEIQIQTWQNDTEYVNFSFDSLEGADPFVFPSFIDPPHFDGQWHNIIINFDKTNSTFPVKVCIDGTEAVGGECRSVPINNPANFDLTDPTYTLILAPIFEEIDNSFEVFEMDEIAIWEDYLLTDSEIDQVASMSVGSSPDTDGDGIFNEVDTLPNTFSDDFSDQSLGGTSSGTITTRGDQTLTITEEPNPSGVRISADVSGGLLPAVVSTCGDISLITLNPGNEIVVTCGSVSIITIIGPVEVSFNLDNTEANVTLPEDNEITFDPDFFSFTAPLTNTEPLVILVNGTEITLNPGSTISLGLLKITKLTTGGDDTFDFTVTGPTSYNPSINTDSGGVTRSSTTTLMQQIDDSVEEDLFEDLGSNGKIAQAFSLNGQKISQVIFEQIDVDARTGTLTAYVWADISDGTNDGDEVVIQQSDVLDLSITIIDQFQAFNFTNPVSFTGTAYIGLVWENVDDVTVITGTDQDITGGTSLYHVDGCFVVSSGVWNQGCSAFLSNGLEFISLHFEHDTTVGDFHITSGINTESLVIYQTFDSAQISSDGIAINEGIFGSQGDLSSLIDDSPDSVIGDRYKTGIALNSSSILGQALIKDNDNTVFHIGTFWEKNPIWNYLYDSTPNEWSMSFWLKGDLDDSNIVPILNTDEGGGNSGISFGFQDNKPYLRLNSAATGDIINATFNTASGFPNDGNFHLITINVEKSNVTNTVQICIDIDCATEDMHAAFDPITFDHTQGSQLIIGENEDDLFQGVNTIKQFQIDDLCIWKGSLLSTSQRNTLYNSGNGQACATASGNGIGMDGPTPVDPGTYSIQEMIPAGWNLTTATCNDGVSSFSLDTVSGIVIDSGVNIECTFENEFAVSTDKDGDGIFNDVDTLPDTASDDFSDVGLGGTSSGTITTRGDQTLTITEEPNPDGVRITADVSGGLLPAVVNACDGISIIDLSPGDDIVVTCGSVTIDVINGPVEITFIGSEGMQATTTLTAGNSITFDQDTFSFSAPATNPDPVVVIVDGEQIIMEPGQAASVVSSNKDSFIKQGELNTNEGVNTMMRVRDNGNNRALISFNQNEILATAQERTLSSATLRIYIEENGNNWGPNGRTIDLHKLLEDWTEGNGFNDKPASMSLSQFNELKTRGDGLGVTWKCATDTEINNQQTDCSPQWNGATFSLTPTDTITIFKDNPPTGTVKTVGWIEFDVTSDLQTFLSTEQNYGWIVKKTEEGEPGLVEFTSDEASVNTPELILVFD